MKIVLISSIFMNLLFLFNSEYENPKACVAITNPSNKYECHAIPSQIISMGSRRVSIACCYVEYSTDDEGVVKMCVPIYKTINGLHMYEEQLENLGANSISMNCSSQKIFISFIITIISCLSLF